jgi:hypothetical protein
LSFACLAADFAAAARARLGHFGSICHAAIPTAPRSPSPGRHGARPVHQFVDAENQLLAFERQLIHSYSNG